MKRSSIRACVLGLLVASSNYGLLLADEATETILFIRHGEKPANGLGQLSCQGLNRALALPGVLRRKYGRIDAVYAPNPSQQKPDGEGEGGEVLRYDYVRPLATVEPAAIAFDLPIHAELGYSETAKLQAALLGPAYRNATVLVGWEHHALNAMMPALVTALGGDGKQVIPWERKDFDTIWRLVIRRQGDKTSVAFAVDRQGLSGLPETCPDSDSHARSP